MTRDQSASNAASRIERLAVGLKALLYVGAKHDQKARLVREIEIAAAELRKAIGVTG